MFQTSCDNLSPIWHDTDTDTDIMAHNDVIETEMAMCPVTDCCTDCIMFLNTETLTNTLPGHQELSLCNDWWKARVTQALFKHALFDDIRLRQCVANLPPPQFSSLTEGQTPLPGSTRVGEGARPRMAC